jgi:hypothetical protein
MQRVRMKSPMITTTETTIPIAILAPVFNPPELEEELEPLYDTPKAALSPSCSLRTRTASKSEYACGRFVVSGNKPTVGFVHAVPSVAVVFVERSDSQEKTV